MVGCDTLLSSMTPYAPASAARRAMARRWAVRTGFRLEDFDVLLLPCLLRGNHWTLLLIDLRAGYSIQLLDSFVLGSVRWEAGPDGRVRSTPVPSSAAVASAVPFIFENFEAPHESMEEADTMAPRERRGERDVADRVSDEHASADASWRPRRRRRSRVSLAFAPDLSPIVRTQGAVETIEEEREDAVARFFVEDDDSEANAVAGPGAVVSPPSSSSAPNAVDASVVALFDAVRFWLDDELKAALGRTAAGPSVVLLSDRPAPRRAALDALRAKESAFLWPSVIKGPTAVPQQETGSDCGVYLVTFVEQLVAGDVLALAPEDVPGVRQSLALAILAVHSERA